MMHSLAHPHVRGLLGLLFCLLPLTSHADSLDEAFTSPSAAAKPLVYWFWMGRNVTREGITRDLEELKAAGFGGATMCSLSDTVTPWSGVIANSPLPEIVPYVSEQWWELVHHAASESHRLGLEFGFHNCPGYESSGGPWITPELSMQEICFSQTPVDGAGEATVALPRPTVDPHAQMDWPVFSEETGRVEKPLIPARETYYRDIAVIALPAEGVVARDSVLDLTGSMTADGTLKWTPPPGRWVVYRFGHTTRGTLLQPAPWKAAGLECDKMNPEAVEFHINHLLGKIRQNCGDDIGKGLDFIWFDSYEAGRPTWTPRMRQEFQTRRGYDILPYLATFAQRVVGSEADSKKFAADFDRTLADLYRDVNFAINKKLINAAGLEVRSEPYGGPWIVSEVIPQFDQCAGEFWFRGGGYHPWRLDEVIDGCRKMGQNIVAAEAFTSDPRDCPWNETPAMLKPIGDAAFCDGVNRLMLHRFAHQPFGDAYKPGMTMGQWGTHFDRTQTWWEPGKAWVAYLTRCQSLLQWGAAVVDVPEDFEALGVDEGVIKVAHRRGPEGDLYFVANLSKENLTPTCRFAVSDHRPELWDPVTVQTRELDAYTSANERTTVQLEFAPAQSYFLVFRNPAPEVPGATHSNFGATRNVSEIAGPWRVAFDPKWGGPAEPVTFTKLTDWTQHSERGVRYYSGTARYRTTFESPAAADAPLMLDLGVVHDLARVRLNGSDLGVLWTAPWRVVLPHELLKASGNELEIEITNCWANRLIGDEQEPADCEWAPGHFAGSYLKRFPDWFVKGAPRPSANRVTFTTWNYFTPDSPLLPAGLIGPVQLMSESAE